MKNTLKISAAILGIVVLSAMAVRAGDARDYQVTGPITELTPATITVKKGNDLWQINRNAGTTVKGDLKVGVKVTVHYTMTASDVEVKAAKGDK